MGSTPKQITPIEKGDHTENGKVASSESVHIHLKAPFLMAQLIVTELLAMKFHYSSSCLRAPDMRVIEDNAKISFLISQRKHML